MKTNTRLYRNLAATVFVVVLLFIMTQGSFAQTGTLTGFVKDEVGAGIDSITISVEPQPWTPFSHVYFGYTTDSTGQYTISGISPGEYVIHYNTTHYHYLVQEYYDNKSYSTATIIGISGGEIITLNDAILSQGGVIKGTVTEVDGTTAILGVQITVYEIDTENQIGWAETGADGKYMVGGLPAGNCKVEFSTFNLNYIRQWYNNAEDFSSATSVTVVAGNDIPDIDAKLSKGGTIQGTVTEEDGTTAISGVQVEAYNVDTQNYIGFAQTDADGKYTVGGLPGGTFKVQFSPWNLNYFRQWYNGAEDFSDAASVTLSAGGNAPGIDAKLSKGGTIQGTVTDGMGDGINGIVVEISDSAMQTYIDFGQTDATGKYRVGGLPTGTYKVVFNRWPVNNYFEEWYDDKGSFSNATIVNVTVSSDTLGIDAQLRMKNDTIPPQPDPLTWAIKPFAATPTSVSMSATAVQDRGNPPVSYYFHFVDSPTGGTGGAGSSWQSDSSFINSGLQPNHRYDYRVKARDGATTPNETGYSSVAYAYTKADTPGKAVFTDTTAVSLRANWTANGNPKGTWYVCENTTLGTNSGWLTDLFWDSGNLQPNKTYSFRVRARNWDGSMTDWVDLGSQTTEKYDIYLPLIIGNNNNFPL